MAVDAALIPLAASVLVASLVGSPHCAGMCGGFVCFYSGQDGARRLGPHVAYHVGRWLSYVSLGALAGAIGVGLDRLGAAAGLQRAAAVLTGFALLVWGGVSLLRATGVRLALPLRLERLGVPVAAAMRCVHAQPPLVRAGVLGLVTTLLPCGWLYLYVATAAGTGSPLAGATVMTAFWLGTVPVLAGLGVVAQRAIAPLNRRLPAITSAALIVAGLLTITGKFHVARGGVECRHVGGITVAGRAANPHLPGDASGTTRPDHEHGHR
jgi:sulfite exporter TauE/SafE